MAVCQCDDAANAPVTALRAQAAKPTHHHNAFANCPLQDYHVCDVAAVFKKPPHGISKKATFTMHFPGLQFKKSMFYDNYNLWIQTPVAFCTRYADYGCTEKGSWRTFLTAHVRYLEKCQLWHERQEKHKKWQVEQEKERLSL
jgi:hypothetical protein